MFSKQVHGHSTVKIIRKFAKCCLSEISLKTLSPGQMPDAEWRSKFPSLRPRHSARPGRLEFPCRSVLARLCQLRPQARARRST